MSWLLSWFQAISDTITTIINLVIGFISGLFNLFIKIPVYFDVLISSINFLPSFIIPFAIASLSIMVIQYVVNRR